MLPLVPAVAILLTKSEKVKKYDLSSVKMIRSGGSSLHKETAHQVQNKLGAQTLDQGYGMTETTLGVILTVAVTKKPGSVGQVVPATLCKVNYLFVRPCGKESTRVRIIQNKGKESEN